MQNENQNLKTSSEVTATRSAAMKKSAAMVVLIFLLVAVSTVSADTIVLKDGRKFDGQITGEDSNTVKLKTKYGTLTFPHSDIANIERSKRSIVTLKNGNRMEGVIIKQTEEAIELETGYGVLRIPRQEVAEIKETESVQELYKNKRKELAEHYYTLALWAKEKNLKEEAQKLLEKVIELDSEHEGARLALGHSKVDGKWVRGIVSITEKELPAVGKGLEIITPHYILQSDLEKEISLKVADSLEWIHKQYEKVFGAGKTSPEKMIVRAFKDPKTYRQALQVRAGFGGYFPASKEVAFAYASNYFPRLLFNNCCLQFIDAVFGRTESGKVLLPAYFTSGAALYFEGFASYFSAGIPAENATKPDIPSTNLDSVREDLALGNYYEPANLIRVPDDKVAAKETFYGWSVIYHLLQTDAKNREIFNSLLQALLQNKRSTADFENCIDDLQNFTQKWKSFLGTTVRFRGEIAKEGNAGKIYLYRDQIPKLLQEKKAKEALSLCEKILAEEPNDKTALYNAACASSVLGDKTNAVRYLEKAVKAGFDDTGQIKSDPNLKNIRDTEEYKIITGEKKDF
jgi:tetratricopeptide (TPR) repeat protein